jgi:hypothetical protein
MLVVPLLRPIAVPEFSAIDATVVSLLLQVPDTVSLANVVLEPLHIDIVPDMSIGNVCTAISIVL